MERKIAFGAAIVFLLIVAMGAYLLFAQPNSIITGGDKSGVTLSDEEIKEKFRCNRITLEVLQTDVYCENPDLYRQHVRDNAVIPGP